MEVERPSASPSAAAPNSPEASQENDQRQVNSVETPHGAPSVKQQEESLSLSEGCGSRRNRVMPKGPPQKGRSKCKPGVASGSGGSGAAASSKFVSAEAILEAACEIKDKLPEVSKELLESLKARGLEPCTLQEVLEERGLQWAATQVRDERAEAEHVRLFEAFQRQFKGWGNNREGWVHNKWNSVIICPDFKRGGLQVSRSSMREMWNSIMSVVNGFVRPDLLVCRVTDPTHPVRFATPPNESCFTVVYAGKEPLKAAKERRILGEYTGHVRAGKTNEHRFEYVFDLSFCALAWRAAEEFEKESDTSGDEVSPDGAEPAAAFASSDTPKTTRGNAAKGANEPASEGKRRVQVTGSQNMERVALPVRGELVLDSHDACNQMSLVNHYGTIGLLGERVCHVNTEWQQVFVDGWPHIVLTTIPGIAIEPGDEVLADFGYDWFNRVQDASHRAIARELLNYRIGATTGGCQTLAPARSADCVVRDSDKSLQTRARMGEVCPYCHSDEIPVALPLASKAVVKASQLGGVSATAMQQETEQRPMQPQVRQTRETQANTEKMPAWGEQVVHCDACDRPCHLRCIFGAHSADQRPIQLEQQQQQEEQQLAAGDTAAGEAPRNVAKDAKADEGKEAAGAHGGVDVTDGETVDEVYRWFVEGDCKWYCCVCRLQWEMMASAMNFTIDWKARKVLMDGNPLMPPSTNEGGVRDVSASLGRLPRENQNLRDSDTCVDAPDASACGNKRRSMGIRRGSVGNELLKRHKKVVGASPPLTRSSRGVASYATQQEGPEGAPLSVIEGERDVRLEADGSGSQGMSTEATSRSAVGEEIGAAAVAAASAVVGETIERISNISGEVPGSPPTEAKPVAVNEGQAGLSTGATKSPASAGDSDTVQSEILERGQTGVSDPTEEAMANICNQGREEALAAAAAGMHSNTPDRGDLVVKEAMRVYQNSSEKARTSKMQPCPVAVVPAELSSEELLGCRTEMLVEPRALLGSLQPCVRCYKLYGAKASVEVCRLTKRHLAPNWDHPHCASPSQIQDALLTCFQDALLAVQRDHRDKLQRVFESMTPLQREVNMKTLLSGNRYQRIHANAARRSTESTRKQELDSTAVVTKGMIPLLCVTLGKTKVDFQFPDPENKKKMKWFYGCVTNYQAVAKEVKHVDAPPKGKSTDTSGRAVKDEKEEKITYFTNQFRIDYDDGDSQTVPPHELIEMLMQTGPGSKLDGRKAITTTPLVKMLAPELKKANRQVNYLVRERNRKGDSADMDSDSDEA